MTIAAVVREQGGPFVLEEVELDELRPDEVRVRMVAVGICHTDISASRGVIPFPLPAVLGHEGAGIVVAVGGDVRRVVVGDRVLMTYTSCGRCVACRGGHPSYCRSHLRLNLLGGRRDDGTTTIRSGTLELNAHFFGQSSFAREAVVDERSLVRLAADTTDEEMAVLAPLGCGIQTGSGAVLNTLRPTPGSSVAITGAGAVGLAALLATQLTPASRVIVIDVVPSRLELARDLGATDVVDSGTTDLREALSVVTDGVGVDYAIDSTGNVGVIEALADSLAVEGSLALIGAPRPGSRASIDVNGFLPGRKITGTTMGSADPETFLPYLIDAWRRGRFPIERLERRYTFEQINEAVADASSGVTIKPVLIF
jgi:aryl-alcohol dehydrogenase